MLGGHRGAADDEQVHAGVENGLVQVLRALGRERARHGHAGVADLMETFDDELRLDGLGIDALEELGRLVFGAFRDLLEQRGRVVVARPQAFEVEHSQRAELAHLDHGLGAHDGIHRCADDRNVELIGVDLPRDIHVLRVTGATGRHDGHIVEGIAHAAGLAKADLDILNHVSKPTPPQ